MLPEQGMEMGRNDSAQRRVSVITSERDCHSNFLLSVDTLQPKPNYLETALGGSPILKKSSD